MSTTLTARFATRREAEMTVERLVQQFEVPREAIRVLADGAANTTGVEQAGSDEAAAAPTPEPRDDAPLAGAVRVSVTIADATLADEVRAAFAEFDGTGVAAA